MKRIALAAAAILATVTALFVMWQLSQIVVLFVLSLAIAAMVRGPSEVLMRRGWPKAAALFFVYGAGIGVPLALLVGVGYRMVAETDPLINDLIALYVRLYSGLQAGGAMLQGAAASLPSPTDLTDLVSDEQSEAFINAAVNLTTRAGAVFSQLLIAVVVSIYWTADRIHFERLWLSLLAPEQRARARRGWRALESGVGTYLGSELVQGILAALLLTLGYWLLGFRYPVLLGFAAGVAWFIPLVGGLLGLIPVVLFSLTVAPAAALAAVAYTVVVFLILEFSVEPRLYPRTPYWRVLVLLVMLAMTDAFGLIGLLAAPPLATALQIWLDDLLAPPATPAATAPGVDLVDVHAKLELARTLLRQDTTPSPRLTNLFERLEGLVEKVDDVQK